MEDKTYLVLTGMKVTNENGTFYFSEPGNWIDNEGEPTEKNYIATMDQQSNGVMDTKRGL